MRPEPLLESVVEVQRMEGLMVDTAKYELSGSRTQPMLAPEFERMLEMQRPALDAMAELNSRLYESVAAVNKEWGSFVSRRLKEDFALPEQLAACKTAQDRFRVCVNYFQNACSDYQSEFEEMTKFNWSIAQDTMTTLQSQVTRVAPNKL
jgi:hypothetical protein